METGLNSSERDDIQTMDRQVFRVVVLGISSLFFPFRELAGSPNLLPATPD
jgi:hypothetical protein